MTPKTILNTNNNGTIACLLKTAICTVTSANSKVAAYILFDEGAQCSFVSRDLATQLHIQPEQNKEIQISTFGTEHSKKQTLETATINVVSKSGENIPIQVLIVPMIASPLQNRFRTNIKKFPYLQGIPLAHPITQDENFEVNLLIWTDNYWRIVQDHIIRETLPSECAVCERRARSLACHLGQSPSLLKMYGDIIAEQEKKEFIEQVPPTDSPGKIHYIPHHQVQKDSTTTPTHIVCDCSCHSSPDYPSLNDCFISGPPSLNDMCSILLCFQIHPFKFSTDIEKASYKSNSMKVIKTAPVCFGSQNQAIPKAPLKLTNLTLCCLVQHAFH